MSSLTVRSIVDVGYGAQTPPDCRGGSISWGLGGMTKGMSPGTRILLT
jgi:hypothetical protein